MTEKNNMLQTVWDSAKKPFKWYFRQYKGKWYQRIVTPIATFFILVFLFLAAVDSDFMGLFGKSPSMELIENPVSDEASMIYSADSVLIGKFFSENRSSVDYDDVSKYVVDALISTEDERFYSHHGIDYKAIFAAMKDMMNGKARGASTITQQLVKNLFKTRAQYSTGKLGNVPGLGILISKAKEWLTAIKIENRFSKKKILTMYLNTVDFGSNSFGIMTASKTYFNTTPDKLNAEQAATLIGLLKATTAYNPKINPKQSLERRNVVLGNMLTHNMLTKAEYDSIVKIPIKLEYSVENSYDGEALYFRQYLREYLSDWCNANNVNLFSDGLKIYTTLDTRMQHYAEEAVMQQMEELQAKFDSHWRNMNPWRDELGREIPGFIENLAKKSEYYKILDNKFNGNKDSIDLYMNLPHDVKVFSYHSPDHFEVKNISTIDSIKYMVSMLHTGFVAIEPQTSFVKAWVGDVDFDFWKYDKVTAMRQPGSTFKLFVYSAAFEYCGLTPDDRERDSYITIKVQDPKYPDDSTKKVPWTPHNANGTCCYANVTYRSAFAQSINTIAVKLGQRAGINRVADIAHKMGIRSKLDATPALSLGASDVTLLELIGAYATVMNDGLQRYPVLVTRIEDRDGNEIYNYDEEVRKARRVITYRTAYFMQRLLWGGMHERGGTSQALWGYPINNYSTEFGGKTGTSSNHSDAWFVGATRNLVAGAWVGGEYRCIHFRTGKLGQGSRTALPIFAYFMQRLLADSAFRHYRGMFPDAKEYNWKSTTEGNDTVYMDEETETEAEVDTEEELDSVSFDDESGLSGLPVQTDEIE